MCLTKENFQYLDLPDLMLNIRDYGDMSPHDETVKNYLGWCIEIAHKKLKNEYYDFNDTIEKIYLCKREFFNVGQFLSETKHLIYYSLYKRD